MSIPTFDTLKDKYSYVEVMTDPFLFQNVYVVWRGMATNIRMGDTTTEFDLLVGYDTRKVLQGIVPVHLNFVAKIDVEQPIEVLGKILLHSASGKDGNDSPIAIEGVSVHQRMATIESELP
jgi:hypothetical protein